MELQVGEGRQGGLKDVYQSLHGGPWRTIPGGGTVSGERVTVKDGRQDGVEGLGKKEYNVRLEDNLII